MNTYDSIVSFSQSELNQLLSSYEERLQKKREKNRQKHRHNAGLTLKDTADLIEQKKKEDLEAVVHTIKNNFSNNEIGVKKFKRDTSDEDDEEEDDKKNVTVAEKVDQCIEHYSLQPYNSTDTVPENFISSDFDFDDCITTDFEPQNLIAPEAPQLDYTTDDVLPDYHQFPVLPVVRTKPSVQDFLSVINYFLFLACRIFFVFLLIIRFLNLFYYFTVIKNIYIF
jgi:hypothetical protein